MPNRPIPSSPEYAVRTLANEIQICPNCKAGILWDRGFIRYCRLCGIEGADLRGVVFRRVAEEPATSTGGDTTSIQSHDDPGWSPFPISHRGDADRFIR